MKNPLPKFLLEYRKLITSPVLPDLSRRWGLLIGGDEPLIIQRLFRRFRDFWMPQNPELNLSVWDGEQSLSEFLEGVTQSLPFFADYRLCIINIFDLVTLKELTSVQEKLFHSSGWSVVWIVRCEEGFPESFLNKEGIIALRVPKIKSFEIPYWIQELSRELGISWQMATLELFHQKVGDDLNQIAWELEKLSYFLAGQDRPDREQIQLYISGSTEERVFSVIDLFFQKEMILFHSKLQRLLQQEGSPLGFLSLFLRQIRLLLDPKGEGVPQWQRKKLNEVRKKWTREELTRLAQRVLALDYLLKSEPGDPVELTLDSFLIWDPILFPECQRQL